LQGELEGSEQSIKRIRTEIDSLSIDLQSERGRVILLQKANVLKTK
jgi:hypothetical protein